MRVLVCSLKMYIAKEHLCLHVYLVFPVGCSMYTMDETKLPMHVYVCKLVVSTHLLEAIHMLGAWKNMPMMAIIARRPFASSADNFLVFSTGSLDVKTLKPKSPAAAGVPGDWS